MVILGKDLAVWVYGSDGKLVRIAKDKSCSISIAVETKTVTGKTVGKWVRKRAVRLSWSISSSNLFTTSTFDMMFAKMVSMEPVIVTFSPVRSNIYGMTYDDRYRYEGEAYITDLSGSADKGDAGQISVQFVGSGPLGKIENGGNKRVFDITFDDKFE